MIFVPSISVSEHLRNSIDGFQTIQNMFLSVLYQLIDPYLHILYVTPVHFSNEEIAIHEKTLLELGINVYSKYGKRLHFIVPENTHRLPNKMNLSQTLFYSTAAIKKTKNLIYKFKTVFFLPTSSSFSVTEKKLAILFQIPVLGLDPLSCHKISSISVMKKVLLLLLFLLLLLLLLILLLLLLLLT